jgi:hypothetical protein
MPARRLPATLRVLPPGARSSVNRHQQTNMVVHHTARKVRQQSSQIARQNMMRLQAMNRSHVARLVHEVVNTPATLEDFERLAGIVQDAQLQELGPDQVGSSIRESTPFAALAQFLLRNRVELAAYLTLLVEVIHLVVALRAPEPTQTITSEQVEQNFERVVEHVDQESRPEPAPTTIPPGIEREPPSSPPTGEERPWLRRQRMTAPFHSDR